MFQEPRSAVSRSIRTRYSSCLKYIMRHFPRKSIIHRLVRAISIPTEMEFDGARLFVVPKDNFTEEHLFSHNQHPESRTYEYIKSLCLKKKILFVDIGANVGIYSIPLSLHAGPESKFICYEPQPAMRFRLEQNIKLNGVSNISVKAYALGSHNGSADLFLPPGRLGSFGRASMVMHKGSNKSVRVDVRTLCSEDIYEVGFDIIIIKVDVEGFEDQVLYDYIESTPRHMLPYCFVIETDHRQLWQRPLEELLTGVGYTCCVSADGNSIYVLVT